MKFANHAPTSLFWVLPFTLYFVFFLKYVGDIPALDQMVIYEQSIKVHQAGLARSYQNYGSSLHPPLLYLINGSIFEILGSSLHSYALSGLLIFLLALIPFYTLLERLFNAHLALIACVFTFCSPLWISNCLYPTSEPLVISLILTSLYFFIFERHLGFAASLGLLALTKHTGLVAAGVFFMLTLCEVFIGNTFSLKKLFKRFSCFIPLGITLLIWRHFLVSVGAGSWNAEIRDPLIENTNSYSIVFNSFKNMSFFNDFLIENISHFVVLNFQWVYFLICTLSLPFLIKHFTRTIPSKTLLVSIFFALFTISYSASVLAFPTWTIPRYVLPLYPGLFLLLAYAISKMATLPRRITIVMLFMVLMAGLYSTADPISKYYFKIRNIHNNKFYNLSFAKGGVDTANYSLVFFEAVREQNKQIFEAFRNQGDILASSNICHDEKSFKTPEKLLNLSTNPSYYMEDLVTKPLTCVLLPSQYPVEQLFYFYPNQKIFYVPEEH